MAQDQIYEMNLIEESPQNEYYHYMFRSTLYRLCAVLGWLRAVNLGNGRY